MAGRRSSRGGSSGIGRRVARALLEVGNGVTVVARREAKLLAAVDGLRHLGPVQPAVADLRAEEAIQAAVDAHRERFGTLHVLVNNAGVAIGGSVEDTAAKTIDLSLAVNLRSAMLFSRAAVELLVAAAPSHVFNLSSLSGLLPQPGMSAYSAAKAGLIAYTDSFRSEFASRGVKATAIAPGFVDTAMSDSVRSFVDPSELIQVSDVVEIVVSLLRLSPSCVVPTVTLEGIGGGMEPWARASHGLASAT